jgi:hypothetical protein
MPQITGLSTSNVRLANTALAATFFPRVLRSVWPRVCGLTKSSALAEPFTFLGAAPLLKLYNGAIPNLPMASYQLTVPNPLWKNIEFINRSQFEFDQTRTLSSRIGALGVKVVQNYDYLLARTIINGSVANSQYFTLYDNQVQYTMTLDALPIYATNHTLGASGNQSNLLQGQLPSTIAALDAQDLSVTIQQMWRDIQQVLYQISTWVDDKGALIFPDFDAKRQLVLMIPPCLDMAAEQGFRIASAMVGGSNGTGGSSGSTSTMGYRVVKDVISWNLLTGVPDIQSALPNATITPTAPTAYYIMIEGDYGKPYYFQRFLPIKQENVQPPGSSFQAEVDRILAVAGEKGLDVRPEAAEMYAATEIDHNLGALGANAQESVAGREEFFISARTRGMVFPGVWINSLKIDPTGTSG